jgi:hypothetical protein
MQDSHTVVATRGDTQIELPIGSHEAIVNGRRVTLDTPAETIGGSTMVPLRFVSEALGADVGWSDATQTVMIDTGGPRAAADTGRTRNDNQDRANAPVRNQDRANVPVRNTDRQAPAYYRSARRVVIPAGTVIPVTLDQDISSDGNQPGDRFQGTVNGGVESAGLPDGAKLEGVVDEAIPARNGKPGVLTLQFRRAILPDGQAVPVDARVTSLDSKSVTHDSAGRLVARSSNNNETLKWVGIGAGAGYLLSTVTRGNRLLDTILGGGAGYLFNQLQNKGAHNVHLTSGTRFGARLTSDMSFRPNSG